MVAYGGNAWAPHLEIHTLNPPSQSQNLRRGLGFIHYHTMVDGTGTGGLPTSREMIRLELTLQFWQSNASLFIQFDTEAPV